MQRQHQPAPLEAGCSLQDELIWTLLLQELWQEPDMRVVSKLLCCSRSMARLVHSTCAGRLKVGLLKSRKPSAAAAASSRTPPSGPVLGRWLAKHLQLVQALAYELLPGDEDALVAGIQLATCSSSSSAAMPAHPHTAGRMTTRAATAASTAAAATLSLSPLQVQHASTSSSTGQLLSLSALLLHGTTSGSLLQVLAGTTQLTQLHLSLSASVAAREARRSLASLMGLQDLQLQIACSTGRGGAGAAANGVGATQRAQNAARRTAEELLPGLLHLTKLTSLRLLPGCLRGRNCRHLPPSLRSLISDKNASSAASINLSHLSDLTQLSLTASCRNGALMPGDVLPPSLQALNALVDINLGLVRQLPELRCLDCNWPISPADVQQLRALPKLDDLRLAAQHWQIEEAAALLAQLPLKQLTFDIPSDPLLPNLLANLPQWKRLENLFIMARRQSVPFTFTAIAAQLKKLPALHTLAITCMGGAQHPGALSGEDWGAFVQDMRSTSSLRTLMVVQVGLGDMASQLVSVSQLTRLALVCCGVAGEAKQHLVDALGASCVLDDSLDALGRSVG